TIDEDEMKTLWLTAQRFVGKTASRHYKFRQSKGYRYEAGGPSKVLSNPLKYGVVNNEKYEAHQFRVLWFMEFVKENSHQSTRWCIDAWKRRSSWVEMLVECKVNGISLYGEDIPITKQINRVKTRNLVKMKAFVRKHIDDINFTDFKTLKDAFKDEYQTTDEHAKKMVANYAAFLYAKYPKLSHERTTLNKPKRSKQVWD
ncbi:MAG: hypothetical protein GWN31_04650, partial [Candidatus Thorarchaeota archaeon]|nr:hypothetical protein [Candidatus Thorarchaeota archaeon]